jgi:hypothetical protein
MGFFGKAARLIVGGGPEAEGLAILRESLAELDRATAADPGRVVDGRWHEARALKVILSQLRSRGLVSIESEAEALRIISEHESKGTRDREAADAYRRIQGQASP